LLKSGTFWIVSFGVEMGDSAFAPWRQGARHMPIVRAVYWFFQPVSTIRTL
jgi:hypothetical protein